MKIVITAIALVFALPAAAQTAPAPQHQDHQQHQGQAHAQPGQHQMTQHSQHQAGQQGQHQGHDMRSGCCADRNNNGRMDCCENMAQGDGRECSDHGMTPAQQPQPQSHQNH